LASSTIRHHTAQSFMIQDRFCILHDFIRTKDPLLIFLLLIVFILVWFPDNFTCAPITHHFERLGTVTIQCCSTRAGILMLRVSPHFQVIFIAILLYVTLKTGPAVDEALSEGAVAALDDLCFGITRRRAEELQALTSHYVQGRHDSRWIKHIIARVFRH
jgi:hypothetical protein